MRRPDWKRPAIIIGLVIFALVVTVWTLNQINMIHTGREKVPQPHGGFWAYEVRTLEVKPALSYEMRDYNRAGLRDDLNREGNYGGELVALLPVGGNYVQAIFKRRAADATHIPEFDRDASRRAIEAESKAHSENFQREMDAIRRR